MIVTHDPEVGDRARRCIRLVDGRVVSDGKPRPAPTAAQEGNDA
jgi:hypothetical protein